jgi:tRNA A37 threonylcarbamoyladenosine dehydratase
MKQRLLDINPQLKLKTIDIYLKNEKIDDLLSQNYNYVVDAIDTLSPKFFFIMKCLEKNLPGKSVQQHKRLLRQALLPAHANGLK